MHILSASERYIHSTNFLLVFYNVIIMYFSPQENGTSSDSAAEPPAFDSSTVLDNKVPDNTEADLSSADVINSNSAAEDSSTADQTPLIANLDDNSLKGDNNQTAGTYSYKTTCQSLIFTRKLMMIYPWNFGSSVSVRLFPVKPIQV